VQHLSGLVSIHTDTISLESGVFISKTIILLLKELLKLKKTNVIGVMEHIINQHLLAVESENSKKLLEVKK
jgi:hypothetical protein